MTSSDGRYPKQWPLFALLAALPIGCVDPVFRAYDGPELPRERIAIVVWERRVWVTRVDSKGLSGLADARREVHLLPGWHEFEILLLEYSRQNRSPRWMGFCILEWEAKADHTYMVHVSTTSGNEWTTSDPYITDHTTGEIVAHASPGCWDNHQKATWLHVLAMGGDRARMETKLRKGLDVNAQDSIGRTPIHYAALFGHHEVVTLLLDRGATVNPVDNLGRTPLDLAKLSGSERVIELLREHGGRGTW